MRSKPFRLSPATLLLVVLLFSVLPRTFFHHCTAGNTHSVLDTKAGAVHADGHCAICEAPVPMCDAGPAIFLVSGWLFLGVSPVPQVHLRENEVRTEPRPRGPPQRV